MRFAPVRWLRAQARSGGAQESGLAHLTELHFVHSAGDALITIALAGTLFFSVPTEQARGRVALYLLITMAPFAVIAPVVGPVLDRFRHGRRYAMAVTLFGRALLALGIARALSSYEPLALYPAAFGILVGSRAFGISRSAAMPRLQPPGSTLTQVNARMSIAALLGAAVAGPVGIGVNWALSPPWTLRAATVVYVAAGVLALRLPARVDSAAGEARLAWRSLLPRLGRLIPSARTVGPHVANTLRSAAALRALNGFLIFFVAFLIRGHHVSHYNDKTELGMLAVAAGAGGLAGTALGAWLRKAPEAVSTATLAAVTLVCIVTAKSFGLGTVLALALMTGAGQSLTKLALDSTIQRDIGDAVRTSTFGRSDTLLQLCWVAGGGVGIVLPADGTLGFALAATMLTLALVAAVRSLRVRPRAPGPPPAPAQRSCAPSGGPGSGPGEAAAAPAPPRP